jgi:hypothetical protein
MAWKIIEQEKEQSTETKDNAVLDLLYFYSAPFIALYPLMKIKINISNNVSVIILAKKEEKQTKLRNVTQNLSSGVLSFL